MRGQSFGMVEETPVPHSATPVPGKKEPGGEGEEECRPIPRNSHSVLITRTQRHPTVPRDAGIRHSSPLTSNPQAATHSHGDTPRVTQGHHSPRGHTTLPYSFTTPSHRDARLPRHTHCHLAAQCSNTYATQHTQPRGCAHRHIKERTRRAETHRPTAGDGTTQPYRHAGASPASRADPFGSTEAPKRTPRVPDATDARGLDTGTLKCSHRR